MAGVNSQMYLTSYDRFGSKATTPKKKNPAQGGVFRHLIAPYGFTSKIQFSIASMLQPNLVCPLPSP